MKPYLPVKIVHASCMLCGMSWGHGPLRGFWCCINGVVVMNCPGVPHPIGGQPPFPGILLKDGLLTWMYIASFIVLMILVITCPVWWGTLLSWPSVLLDGCCSDSPLNSLHPILVVPSLVSTHCNFMYYTFSHRPDETAIVWRQWKLVVFKLQFMLCFSNVEVI